MAGPKFDVTTDKGLAAFNGFMGSKSYIEGYSISPADKTEFDKFQGIVPDPIKLPHAYRWYIHIAALTGGAHGVSYSGPPVSTNANAATTTTSAPSSNVTEEKPKAAPKPAATTEEDDFDVFGDDDDAEKEEAPTESRADMLARLKKEAEERTIAKEAKQRTIVAIEIKPWDVEQDLMLLFKKITETITQDGMKWAENCNLADVAFGIKKIQTTFTMGATNSSDDIVEAILAMEDEVQSCEVMSMNVL